MGGNTEMAYEEKTMWYSCERDNKSTVVWELLQGQMKLTATNDYVLFAL